MPSDQGPKRRDQRPWGALLLLTQAVTSGTGCGEKPSFGDIYDSRSLQTNFADGINGGNSSGSDTVGILPPGADGSLPSANGDIGGGGEPLPGTPPTPARRMVITEGRFPADLVVQSEVGKEFGLPNLSQTITLQRISVNKDKKVQQVTRPSYRDEYTQLPTGLTQVDNFDQVANRALDILVVVDNSPSMKDNQKKLAERLDTLLTYVKDSDWVIGVTTTDPRKSCLRGLIKKDDVDAQAAYERAVTPGTHGFFVEKGILTAVRSLQGHCLEQPWIRDQSTLAVLYVTDEDNCSDGDDCKHKPWSKGSYLTDYLKTIREPGMNARVYGLIWPPNVPKDQCKSGRHVGKIYAQVIQETKGMMGSICEDDWSPTLMQVSKDIKETLNTKFTLKFAPERSTLKIMVNGVEIKSGFTVVGRVIEINPPPPDRSKVTVSYRHDVTPGQTSFKLRFPPFENRVTVFVNGLGVPPGDYVYNPMTQAVEFLTPPPENAKITLQYRGNMDLNSEYALVDTIRPGSLRVTINGSVTQDFVVNEATGRVTFNTPPPESALIQFTYVAMGLPVYDYPFVAPPGTPPDLPAVDADTLAPLRVTYANGIVSVDPADFVEGRRITVPLANGSPKTYDVVLPQPPLTGTLKAVGGQQTCLPPDLGLAGTIVNLINCKFADDVKRVTVSYSYLAASYQEFVLVVEKIPESTDYQVWTVFVNDLPRTDYTRSGNVIRFSQPLPVGSIVRIQLVQEDI